jgi:hypothetical protein
MTTYRLTALGHGTVDAPPFRSYAIAVNHAKLVAAATGADVLVIPVSA